MKKTLIVILFHFSFFWTFSQTIQQSKLPCFQVSSQISRDQIDNFSISNECMITSFSFQLLNRWGQVVKESKAMTVPLIWGGSDQPNGKKTKKQKKTSAVPEKELEQGVYFYIITFTLEGSNTPEKQTGNLSIN